MGFSRQGYWSGLPCPSPGDLPDPGIKPVSVMFPALAGGLDPWVRKAPWRRAWQPPPVFLPGESHGQRSLEGYSPWGHTELDVTKPLTQTQTHTGEIGDYLISRVSQTANGSSGTLTIHLTIHFKVHSICHSPKPAGSTR